MRWTNESWYGNTFKIYDWVKKKQMAKKTVRNCIMIPVKTTTTTTFMLHKILMLSCLGRRVIGNFHFPYCIFLQCFNWHFKLLKKCNIFLTGENRTLRIFLKNFFKSQESESQTAKLYHIPFVFGMDIGTMMQKVLHDRHTVIACCKVQGRRMAALQISAIHILRAAKLL